MQARRLHSIAPFRVVELLERAKALEADGHRVVHLEVGEPDFPTAEPIVAAAHRALDAGATKYTQALGIPALRERIATYYAESAGLQVAADRVVVTSGASAGLLLLAALLLNPDDELLLTDPGYPCNDVFAQLVNARPVPIPLDADAGFRLDLARVAAAWGAATRGMLIGSPANPTGTVLPAATLRELVALVGERGGFLLLDEIYQGLIYPGRDGGEPEYRTGLELDDQMFVLNSFSKYFGMTGWRLGWIVMPEAMVPAVARLAQNLFISPPSLSQHAALAAFEPPAMAVHEARRAAFGQRCERLCDGLEALGLRVPARPGGAFYVYVDVSSTGLAAEQFCWRLLEEHHVAVTPGIDFGTQRATDFVRFAFTTSEQDIELGLERLGHALEGWRTA